MYEGATKGLAVVVQQVVARLLRLLRGVSIAARGWGAREEGQRRNPSLRPCVTTQKRQNNYHGLRRRY